MICRLDKKAKQRYLIQRTTADRRGIPFKLTFEEWTSWWASHGVDRSLPQEKNSKTLCMCRYNDVGAYELGNIYCDTTSNNIKLSFKLRKANGTFRNHTSRQIGTPSGYFNTIKEGCETLGIPRWTLEKLMKTNPKEYYRVV